MDKALENNDVGGMDSIEKTSNNEDAEESVFSMKHVKP